MDKNDNAISDKDIEFLENVPGHEFAKIINGIKDDRAGDIMKYEDRIKDPKYLHPNDPLHKVYAEHGPKPDEKHLKAAIDEHREKMVEKTKAEIRAKLQKLIDKALDNLRIVNEVERKLKAEGKYDGPISTWTPPKIPI